MTKRTPYNIHCTALLIGNKFGFLKRLAFALQHRGHSVVWADTGETGLHLAESEQPGLIISEIRLPDISGMEVCRRVKSSFFFETPVVLVGLLRDEKIDSPLAFQAGAEDYFVSFTERRLVVARLEWLVQRGRFNTDPSAQFEVVELLKSGDCLAAYDSRDTQFS